MSQDKLIKLQSTAGTKTLMRTTKNKKTVLKKLELKKYDKKVRKHVTFKEVKK